MNHYVDIQVRPGPELEANHLLSALYAKLHRELAAQPSLAIGVSFPGIGEQVLDLGTCLRLHGVEAALSALLASDWLTGMRDHVTLTPPQRVPDKAQHRAVRRVQVKSNPERLRRRLMRRLSLSEQEARQRIPDSTAIFTLLPFLRVRSTSTGQSFRLFIEHGPIQSDAVAGAFNAYGLSQEGTIPWF